MTWSRDVVFDAKVINDEAEDDVAPHVVPKARGVLAVVITPGIVTLFK